MQSNQTRRRPRNTLLMAAVIGLAGAATSAHATIVSVVETGGPSSASVPAAIIGAPPDLTNDLVTNLGMEGFDEAQGVTTTAAYTHDFGVIPIGTLVDSHMIFLNGPVGFGSITHTGVIWTFDTPIIAVMSDSTGSFEAASTAELGAPGTNYTVPTSGGDLVAPFAARGMEGSDSYMLIGSTQILVNMGVSQPGDWIRVVTSVPEPGTVLLLGATLAGLGFRRRAR